MYNSIHSEFISSPLSYILADGINASNCIGDGMETYPLCEYLLQSLFLKMTGAQEQKMKCICWELASNDYEYRYDFLNKKNYGECSDYKSKNGVFNDLIMAIKKMDPFFIITNFIDNSLIINVKGEMERILDHSNLSIWKSKEYVFYNNSIANIIKDTQIGKCNEKSYPLFQSELMDNYTEIVYKHRNRCAHNTLSYQTNLPDLSTIASKNYDYHNYFVRFAILILIDVLFIKLYKYYLSLQNGN